MSRVPKSLFKLLELKEESGQWKAEVIFMAKDVPSLGYKTYRVLPAKSKENIRASLLPLRESWRTNLLD